MHDHIIAIRT